MSDSTQHDRPAEGFSDPAKGQADFYGAMYAEQKFSPQAVASGQQIYKDLRFQRLSRVFESVLAFSLHDVGMGLGHYYEYLKKNFPDRKIAYSGSEVVEDFYDHCRRQYPECTFFLRDFSAEEIEESYDYVVFGGTFYHLCNIPRSTWEQFMFRMLERAFAVAQRGIAFNVVTQYCDFYEPDLYYCDIPRLLGFITHKLSRFFVIDHAYPLYELTVSVYHEQGIRDAFPQPEYAKYFK